MVPGRLGVWKVLTQYHLDPVGKVQVTLGPSPFYFCLRNPSQYNEMNLVRHFREQDGFTVYKL